MLCARYLLIENESGDGEDIDCFAILFHRRPQHAFFGLSYRLYSSINNQRVLRDSLVRRILFDQNKCNSIKP